VAKIIARTQNFCEIKRKSIFFSHHHVPSGALYETNQNRLTLLLERSRTDC